MSWQLVTTFGVLAAIIGALLLTLVAPDMVLLGGLAVLLVAGIVSPADALAGFSNEGVATIAALFVVAEGLKQTGGLSFVSSRVLGKPRTLVGAQLRVMAPVAGFSAFVNNTPVVAMLMPIVIDWARRLRLPVSQLLLPLSYASILGGLITVVGTSSTLIVNGLLLELPGQRGLSMFELAWIGVPATVVGLIFVPLASRRVLAGREDPKDPDAQIREYTTEMVVDPSSPVVGKTIEAAGLRNLPGVYLMGVQREQEALTAVPPNMAIEAHDRLLFVGAVESIIDLQKIPGLVPAADQVFRLGEPRSHRCLVEAVVSSSFRFRGMTIRESAFRTIYNAVVIAVSRHGERVDQRIGDIRLQAGDTLLIETHESFLDAQRYSRDFFLVSRVEDSSPLRHERAWVARLLLLGMVLLVMFEVTSLLKAACLSGAAMILTRCLRVSQAKQAVDWGVLVGIAAGIGIGHALQSSGADSLLTGWLLEVTGRSPLASLGLR
ncbi:MAG: SLC13 family permease [Nannocystaceae bacterium]